MDSQKAWSFLMASAMLTMTVPIAMTLAALEMPSIVWIRKDRMSLEFLTIGGRVLVLL